VLARSVSEGWKEPIWDRVSAEMAHLGFNKSPKQCKERSA